MEIVIGDQRKSTSINTEDRKVAVSLDKGDKLIVVLGINRVNIEFLNGSWTVSHGSNVVNENLFGSDDKAFCNVGQKLEELQ